MRLRDAVPHPHFSERHAVTVAAPPERVWDAVRSVTPSDAPLLRLLFRARGLPAARDRSVLDHLRATGFRVLHEVPPRELVLGAVGRPWRPAGALRADAPDLARFAEPGYAVMGLDFRIAAAAHGSTLETETRVALTDALAYRRFRLYWLAVRPFSGLVRRSWLRATKRPAEQRP